MSNAVAEAGATVLLHVQDENLLRDRHQHLQELLQRADQFVFDVANDEKVLAAVEKSGSSMVS